MNSTDAQLRELDRRTRAESDINFRFRAEADARLRALEQRRDGLPVPTVDDICQVPDEQFMLEYDEDDKVHVARWQGTPKNWGVCGHGDTAQEAILRCRVHLMHVAYMGEHPELWQPFNEDHAAMAIEYSLKRVEDAAAPKPD